MAYLAGFQPLEQRDEEDLIVAEGVVSNRSPFASDVNDGIYDVIAEDLRYLNEQLEKISTSSELAKIRDEVKEMYTQMTTDANFGSIEAKAQAEIATEQAQVAVAKAREVSENLSTILSEKTIVSEDITELRKMVEDVKAYLETIGKIKNDTLGNAQVATTKAKDAATQANNAAKSADTAKAWAESEVSPDSATDTDSTTGMTMSAKTWAGVAKDEAAKAKASEVKVQASADNAKASEGNARTSESNAKTSEEQAKYYAGNAKDSEARTKESEAKVQAVEDNVKKIEDSVKAEKSTLSTLLRQSETNVTTANSLVDTVKKWAEGNPDSETIIGDDGLEITTEHFSAKTWADRAREHSDSAQANANLVKEKLNEVTELAEKVSTEVDNVNYASEQAKGNADSAKASEDNAKISEDNAKESEDNAKTFEESAVKASEKAELAETNANASAERAKAWAESDKVVETTEGIDGDIEYYSAKHYAQEAKEVYDKSLEYEETINEYVDKAKSHLDNAIISENKAKESEDNASVSEITSKSYADNAIESATAASKSEEKTKQYMELAQKWSMSDTTPDDGFDSNGDDGKTMSAKSWANKAKESAQTAEQQKETTAGYADIVRGILLQAQDIQSLISSMQSTVEELNRQSQEALEESRAIKDSISNTVTYKGKVENYSDLPTEENHVGDMYYIGNADEEHNVNAGDSLVWNGTTWDDIGGGIDLDEILGSSKDAKFGTVTAKSFIGSLAGNANTATKAEVADKANSIDWENVSGAPSSFPANGGVADSAMTANVCTGNSKTASSVPWIGVTDKPSTYPPSAHTHDSVYPSVNGARATGTWGISISGNAASAKTADNALNADKVGGFTVECNVPAGAKFTDTDTTYGSMKGATATADGADGLVPKPTKGLQGKFLRGDGMWAAPAATAWASIGSKPASILRVSKWDSATATLTLVTC